ncbi:mutagen sensitive-59 [Fusarium proliferatum]|nr:mutagen sensitive-59 [Fusarium proliferatum]
MLVLRFTTAHRPKNPSVGFIFGSDDRKCDILLSTTRRTGISGKQFAITFHTTTGAVIIRNLSKQRTKIKEQGDRPTKLSTQKVLFGTNVTSIYLPFAELNISKPWQDGEHSALYKAYLAGLASVEPDIRALRLQSSAATGSSVTSVSTAYTRTTTRLGQGSSGIVYQGVHRQTGDLVAIKIYGERKREAKAEGNILQLLRHEHIIELYHLIDDSKDGPQLFMEYAPLGNLEEQCQAQRFRDMDGRSIVRQTLEGLAHIHGKHIIHRDLKPTNILFITREPIHIKLADFTSSTREDYPESYCGTRKYMAPDIGSGPYTFKIDIWSVGVIGTELWIGLPEGAPSNWPDLAGFVLGSRALSSRDQSFLTWLLEPNYEKRPTAQRCLSHNFFHGGFANVMLPLLNMEEWAQNTVAAVSELSAVATSLIPSTARGDIDGWVEDTMAADQPQTADPLSSANRSNTEDWVAVTNPQFFYASSREIPQWNDWNPQDYDCWAPGMALGITGDASSPQATTNPQDCWAPGMALGITGDAPLPQGPATSLADEIIDRWRPLRTRKKRRQPPAKTMPGERPESSDHTHFFFWRNVWIAYNSQTDTINIGHVWKAMQFGRTTIYEPRWQQMMARKTLVTTGKKWAVGNYVPFDDAVRACHEFCVADEFKEAFQEWCTR